MAGKKKNGEIIVLIITVWRIEQRIPLQSGVTLAEIQSTDTII